MKIAANEALGLRKTKKGKKNKNTPWFCKEIKQKCQEKRKAYLKYLTEKTDIAYEEYKKVRNDTKFSPKIQT